MKDLDLLKSENLSLRTQLITINQNSKEKEIRNSTTKVSIFNNEERESLVK